VEFADNEDSLHYVAFSTYVTASLTGSYVLNALNVGYALGEVALMLLAMSLYISALIKQADVTQAEYPYHLIKYLRTYMDM
jgi:hypothetical protein